MLTAKRLNLVGVVCLKPPTSPMDRMILDRIASYDQHYDVEALPIFGDASSLLWGENAVIETEAIGKVKSGFVGNVLNSHEIHLDLVTAAYKHSVLPYVVAAYYDKLAPHRFVPDITDRAQSVQGSFASVLNMGGNSFALWSRKINFYYWVNEDATMVVFSTNPLVFSGLPSDSVKTNKSQVTHFYVRDNYFLVKTSPRRRYTQKAVLLCSGGDRSLEAARTWVKEAKANDKALLLHLSLGQDEDTLSFKRFTNKYSMPSKVVATPVLETYFDYTDTTRAARLGWIVGTGLIQALQMGYDKLIIGCGADNFSPQVIRSQVDFVNFASAGKVTLQVPIYEKHLGIKAGVDR